jgi:preprotein translocase subunit SecG
MYTILIVLAIIVSILLVFIVLIQNSKGGGLAANFAAGNQIFGVRQTADTLEKATWYLSITLGVLCIFATAFPPTSRGEANSSTVQRNNELFHNPTAQPGFGTEQTQPAGDQTQPTEEQPQQQEASQPQETPTE